MMFNVINKIIDYVILLTLTYTPSLSILTSRISCSPSIQFASYSYLLTTDLGGNSYLESRIHRLCYHGPFLPITWMPYSFLSHIRSHFIELYCSWWVVRSLFALKWWGRYSKGSYRTLRCILRHKCSISQWWPVLILWTSPHVNLSHM